VNGRVLHVERQGRGPALMLLHGYTGSAHSMAGIAGRLGGSYETLMPDLPGHGRSTGYAGQAGYSFEQTLGDLVGTLESCGHGSAHWLGYSMGARLALACAVRFPRKVRSLVLLAARAGIEDPEERAARRIADEALAAHIEEAGVAAFVDEWLAQPLFASLGRLGADFLARERQARLNNDARELAASLRGLGPAAQPPLFDQLARVQVPVLLLAGALDTRFVALAHDLARRLPVAEVQEIPDAGHAAHAERPEAFAAAVNAFLRRVDGTARTHSSPSVEEITT
jgi:2-succinyl-6-hydroxy-2,4-cyclohexadiene-1-carboxylate synthase